MNHRILTGLAVASVATAALGQTTNLVMLYDAGLPPAIGSAGAANPLAQGWTYSLGVNNIYVAGYDSTNGGWRTVDGSASVGSYANYQYGLTTEDISNLLTNGWRVTWAAATDRHAVATNWMISQNYYFPPNHSRQNNNGVWLEIAGQFSYYLSFNVTTNGGATNLVVNDQTTAHAIAGPAYDTFRTFTLTRTNSQAVLTVGVQSLNIAPYSYQSGQNRLVFGAHNSSGQGATIWNRVALETVTLPPPPPPSTLRLARVFTSNAVLQRGQPCPVFGVDVPGTNVAITFAGQTLNTTADTNGNWRVNLAAMSVIDTPETLTVSGSTTVLLTNILVGDVWLISGQSNANYPLSSSTGGVAAAAGATNTW